MLHWTIYLISFDGRKLQNASKIYKGSAEERCDVLKEFVAGNGSMVHILNNIPFTRKEDEARIIGLIKDAMEKKEIQRIPIKKLPKTY